MDSDQELRILFVEDLISDAELAQRTLRKEGIRFTSLRVENEADFLAALQEFHPDLIVSDYSLPTFDGMRALTLTLQHDPTLPLIILTGSMNEITAVACMKAGATDYVIKEHITRLPLALKGALEQKENRRAKAQADRELRETNQMLEAIIQASPLAISVLDREAKLTLWSPAMETFFGWKAEEVLGKELPIVPDHLRETFLQEIRKRFEGTSITMMETQRQHKDGSLVDISLSAAPIHDAQGQITGIVGITADISETKRAQRAFIESEERFRALTQSVSDAIIITDYHQQIVFWNKGAEN
jgi:PAS domain S-box-containing protein